MRRSSNLSGGAALFLDLDGDGRASDQDGCLSVRGYEHPSEKQVDGPRVRGRLEVTEYRFVVVDAAASRLTAQSIAGLVVGAMGVFVFAVAFRHWVRQRRAFSEQARA
jgi:hypothetical protein